MSYIQQKELVGAGRRKRRYGAGLIAQPSSFGYGNIAGYGCGYGKIAGGRRAGSYSYGGANKYPPGFIQHAKNINAQLNALAAPLKGADRTQWKIDYLLDPNNGYAPNIVKYLENKYLIGSNNIAFAQRAKHDRMYGVALDNKRRECRNRYLDCMARDTYDPDFL